MRCGAATGTVERLLSGETATTTSMTTAMMATTSRCVHRTFGFGLAGDFGNGAMPMARPVQIAFPDGTRSKSTKRKRVSKMNKHKHRKKIRRQKKLNKLNK